MTAAILHLKKKVVGFQSSIMASSMNILDDRVQGQDGNGGRTDISIPIDNNQKVIILEKQIHELESALQSAREEAFQAGFEEGKEAAQIEAKKELKSVSDDFGSIIQSLKVQYDQTLERMDKPLLKFAMKVAEKILGMELHNTKKCNGFLIGQIKQFLKEAVDQSKITIYMNPNQVDWISKVDILKEMSSASKASVGFVGNSKLKPGECVLETENFIEEGVLSRQLDNLEKQILEIGSN